MGPGDPNRRQNLAHQLWRTRWSTSPAASSACWCRCRPNRTSTVAGVEWYDSGIGFAVPLAGVNSVLPRLAAGNDLYPGLLGVGMKAGDLFSQPAEIAACRPHSPASAAGLRAGDTIVEINGKPVTRQAQFKQELNRHYAGERRAAGRHPLGRADRARDRVGRKDPPLRVSVRRHFASAAPGQQTGRIGRAVRLSRQPRRPGWHSAGRSDRHLRRRTASKRPSRPRERLRSRVPGDKIAIGLVRDGQAIAHELELARLPEDVPRELPAAHPPAEAKGAEPAVGVVSLAVGQEKNGCLAYVPTNYQSDLRYGVVIWLHGTASRKAGRSGRPLEATLRSARFDLARAEVGQPREDGSRCDVRTVRRALDEVSKNYAIDPARVVVHGYEARRLHGLSVRLRPCRYRFAAWRPSAPPCPAG